MAGIGGFIAKFADLQGLLKGIVGALYRAVFSAEIAAAEDERKKLLDKVAALEAQVNARVADDQAQIDDATKQKAPIQDAIKVEERRQAEDEQKIAEVHVEEQKTVDAIKRRSDDDTLRSSF